MAGRDRISELPTDILDNILGFLPIVEAARTAVLSTTWREIWSSRTRLNFDSSFFGHIEKKYSYAYGDIWVSAGLHVISKVLMQHNGPIHEFVFDFEDYRRSTLRSRSFDFDQWLLFVTRKGVEEIHLNFMLHDEYRVPNCIFSCPTLKRLHLFRASVEPINAPCILPNVTSLYFEDVGFHPKDLLDCAVDAPMLEHLSFIECENIFDFNITAPKLSSLTIKYCYSRQSGGFLPVNLGLGLRSICTLELDGSSFKHFVKEFSGMHLRLQPPALNVEYLKLSSIHFPYEDESSAFIDLLRICPKLCRLKIRLLLDLEETNRINIMSKFFEELHGVAQTHKMLHALKLSSFDGSSSQMLFIKGLLASFPAFEKVVIISEVDLDEKFEIMQELLRFPRASTKAELVYI